VSLKLIKLGGIREAFAASKLCRKLWAENQCRGQDRRVEHRHAAAVHLACAVPNVDWA